MTSEKQTQANRRNALKSSGPKTAEGKATIRHNAIKHGLLTEDILLPGEDKDALRELDEHLRAELQPEGEMENLLADRIIGAHWRLRRLGRMEASIFAREHYGELIERAFKEARRHNRNHMRESLVEQIGSERLHEYDKEKIHGVAIRINELEAMHDTETTTLGQTFVRDADGANAFSKLSRYETTIERSLYKAMHELQRLQATRHAEGNVSPPVAVDIDVSGVSGEGL